MPVQTIMIAGQPVLIEVQPPTPEDELPAEAFRAPDRGGLPMENTSVASELADAASRIRTLVGAVVGPVEAAMQSISAEEWTVELSLGFKGGTGIPFVVNGEANGALKVSAKWKRPTAAPSKP